MLRSLALYLVLAVAFVAAVLALQPPPPLPASAPPTTFSAERAMVDVRAIAAVSHPIGGPEIVHVRSYLMDRLRQLGLSPEIHTGLGFEVARFDKSFVAAGNVQNIIAVMPGKDRNKPALLVMSHYDSVRNSPGAADDTAGVAVTLEMIRMLKAGAQPGRDVIFLITEGEEAGLLGAQAFFTSDPTAARVGAVVNFDTRGDSGRTVMFETGPGSAPLIDLYARVVGSPAAQSMASSIYHRMPNDTDFSVSVHKGLPGVNFAFIDDAAAYHTPLSTPDHLNRGTLQHMGAAGSAMARAMADMDSFPATGKAAAPDQVYADLAGLAFFHYSSLASWLLLAGVVVLVVVAVLRALAQGASGPLDTLKGVGAALLATTVAALVLGVAGRLLGLPGPAVTYAVIAHGEAMVAGVVLTALVSTIAVYAGAAASGGRGRWLLVGAALLAGVIGCGLAGGLDPMSAGLAVVSAGLAFAVSGRGTSSLGLWNGALVVGSILCVILQVIDPGLTPPFVWPLAIASLGAVAASFARSRAAEIGVAAVFAAPGLALVLGTGGFLFTAMGYYLPVANALIVLLALPLLAPLLHGAATATVGRAAAGLAAGAAVAGFVMTAAAPSPDRPAITEAFYLADPGQKLWVRASRLPLTSWSEAVLKTDGGAIRKQADIPVAMQPMNLADAHKAALSLPGIGAERYGDNVMLRAAPTRGGDTLVLYVKPSAELRNVRLNGKPLPLSAKAGAWTTVIFSAPPPEGVTLALATPDHASVDFVAAEIRSGWPDGAVVPKAPPQVMPFSRSDTTMTVARLSASW